MSLENDLLLERQRIRRKLIRWRVVAFCLFILACLSLSAKTFTSQLKGSSGYITKLKIEGTIKSDVTKQIELLDKASSNPSVKALILYVNSPGGAVTGGEELHDAVERFAQKKPVVVSMGGVAASAGYMISLPAQRIFALNSTLTGSIGVLMQSPDISKLLDKVGVNVDQLVSGPMKGQPSMVKPLSDQGRQMLQGLISNYYDQFISMVVKSRHMSIARAKQLGDGRPYTGQQALSLGLIDQIGNEQAAKNWLIKTYKFQKNMPVKELKNQKNSEWISHFIGKVFGSSVGSFMHSLVYDSQDHLDGALAIWAP
ncbi:hypothetical protein COMNV_00286 [Commensalibacter sp. Nvir]|uniref:signal peptide peptidase SppA n=1 Tax=Commensalibacter sp. Nvir TaxID=3069817 RepID=UPI002D4FD4A2|nr:hypothetical protein COMNV_00286 [Commensalibacter sp. Nvir]